MSRVSKAIENPEVPGFECLLPPPPPPPPPPPIISKAGAKEQKSKQLSATIETPSDDAIVETVDRPESTIGTIPPGVAAGPPFGNAPDNVVAFASENSTVFAGNLPNPFFAQPPVAQISASEQPWWVPTDSDTAEIVPANGPWIDQSATWIAASEQIASPAGKAKAKFFKRKSEAIDPAQDAERVASAQKELSALMKPLKCDLCNAIMNSTLQAKLHYEGKPHQKKVSMFLNQSVKKIKPDEGQVTSTTSTATDWNTYCDVCKTWFTSQIDASQHYAGKKHIRATTGVTKQKTKKPSNQQPIDPTGRFGIGMAFLTEPQAVVPEVTVAPPVVAPVAPPAAVYSSAAWPVSAFRCDLCGIVANRLEQLETHKRGAKHLKMLTLSGLKTKEPDEVIENTLQSTIPIIDYSIYRTPSGQYYCAPCNRSFHSENSFAQHVDSKKHKTQVNPKQTVPTPVVTKKTNKSSK